MSTSSPFRYLSAADVARRANNDAISYNRVLAACRNGELSYQTLGTSFCILEQDADEWIAKQVRLTNPETVTRLEAEIADLKYQLSKKVQA